MKYTDKELSSDEIEMMWHLSPKLRWLFRSQVFNFIAFSAMQYSLAWYSILKIYLEGGGKWDSFSWGWNIGFMYFFWRKEDKKYRYFEKGLWERWMRY